jgi:hypothetical protein
MTVVILLFSNTVQWQGGMHLFEHRCFTKCQKHIQVQNKSHRRNSSHLSNNSEKVFFSCEFADVSFAIWHNLLLIVFLCKGKVVTVVNYAPHHDNVLRSGEVAPRIYNLGTRRRRVISFMSRPLYPEVRSSGTHWTGGWVGHRAGLDAVAKRKKSRHCLCRELNPSRPARSLVSILTELPGSCIPLV